MTREDAKAVEQEPCEDCISRDRAIKAIDKIKVFQDETWYSFYQKTLNVLNKLPSVHPARPAQCIAEVRFDEDKLREIVYDRIEMTIENAVPTSVIDDIKADILEEKECAYADFERYKTEYLGCDRETAMDDLPGDDFRYGMERALEIMLKHIAEMRERLGGYQ